MKGDRAFQRLRKGRSGGSKHLSLRLRPAHHGEVRVAFVVSRKVGKAVLRNRLRRRLREGLREMLRHPLATAGVGPAGRWPGSFDVLVMVRPSAATAPREELLEGLVRALDRASEGLVPT